MQIDFSGPFPIITTVVMTVVMLIAASGRIVDAPKGTRRSTLAAMIVIPTVLAGTVTGVVTGGLQADFRESARKAKAEEARLVQRVRDTYDVTLYADTRVEPARRDEVDVVARVNGTPRVCSLRLMAQDEPLVLCGDETKTEADRKN